MISSAWLLRQRMPLAIFVLVGLASAAFALAPYQWQGLERAACWPNHCFCEAGRPGPVAQPSNTYSNLAFVLVGLLILADAGRFARPDDAGERPARENLLASHAAYPVTYGLAVIAIGLGSLFFHASLTILGRWFDVMGMYLQSSFMALYGVARLRRLPGLAFAVAYVGINAGLGSILAFAPLFRREIFGGLVLLALALELAVLTLRRPRVQVRYLLSALGSFALAYVIWILDNNGIACSPSSWLQGHALWHLLSAAAAGLIYLYYRSERPAWA